MSIRVMSEFFGLQLGSANRKMVALRLADFADDGGRGIWPTVERVASECELSVSTVQRVLREFVAEGMLIVVKPGGGGRGSSTRYDFDLDRVRARAAELAGEKGVTVTPLEGDAEKGVSEAAQDVTGEALGCHGDTRTVSEPSTNPPAEREGARERGDEGQRQEAVSGEAANGETGNPTSQADTPGRADFEKRVMRFCSGRGFLAGAWKNWDSGASPGWIAKQFAALSPAERLEAERWRDAYLFDIADRRLDPVAPGNYLAGKMWEGLDPVLLERLEKRRQAKLEPAKRAKPDGWAAMAGPVGMAWLFEALLAGASDAAAAAALAEKAFFTDAELRSAWERVWQWRALLRQKGGSSFAPRWHALKDAMEPVPVKAELVGLWKIEFTRRGWPWLAEFERGEVIYAPKGGPDGIEAFERAVRAAAAANGDTGNAGREAAE